MMLPILVHLQLLAFVTELPLGLYQLVLTTLTSLEIVTDAFEYDINVIEHVQLELFLGIQQILQVMH